MGKGYQKRGKGGEKIGAIAKYLARVRFALLPLRADKRKEILAEIKDDIESRARESGIKGEAEEKKFVQSLDNPDILAKRYIEIYGISFSYLLLLVAGGVILAFFSMPLIPFPGGIYIYSEGLAAFSVLLVTLYLIWIFIRFPGKCWAVGGAVVFTRILAYLLYTLFLPVESDLFDAILFFIVTGSLLVVAYAVQYFAGGEDK